MPGSYKNTLSPDKPRPPLLGESPREFSFGSFSRQGWFDQQSTGSCRSWDRIPGSEGGETRAFLDGDQYGDESVRNAPLAHAAGLRFYYQPQRVRKHSTKKQTVNQNNSTLSSPTKTNKTPKPSALRNGAKGTEKGRGGGSCTPHSISRGSRVCGRRVRGRGGGAVGPLSACKKHLLLTPPQPAPPRESAPDPAAMLGPDK